jgi:hypothetical protein
MPAAPVYPDSMKAVPLSDDDENENEESSESEHQGIFKIKSVDSFELTSEKRDKKPAGNTEDDSLYFPAWLKQLDQQFSAAINIRTSVADTGDFPPLW